MLGAGPEIAGITGTVLATPDADIGLVVAACYAVITDMPGVVVVVVAEHTGGCIVVKCCFPGPIDSVC